ncbi:MAG TPA: hypothetical protein VNO30_34810 [Kofleriaceae bacterium]|nr:hypothetical protein [Kofleriaceae bacterium]
MNRGDYQHLLGEKAALDRMLAEVPEEDVLDRSSLLARMKRVEDDLAQARSSEREPARVRLTFRGRPVIGSHGVFVEFALKAVNSFVDSVVAMAASLAGPLAAMGPIPNRDQHQLLITSTAVGSFGFQLEEHSPGQPPLSEPSAVAEALDRTQRLLRGTLGNDEELADSAAETERRVLEKVRGFLQTLVDHEAVCVVQLGESRVVFSDVGQVKTSLERLSQENLREEYKEIEGELQGVLPRARIFELKLAGSEQVVRGKIGPAIVDPDALNTKLHLPARIKVLVTRVGTGRPRYVLIEPPDYLEPS